MTLAAAPVLQQRTASVTFASVDGRTVVTRLRAGNPLKLLVPRQREQSAWVIAATYGGGLLAGDQVSLDLHCDTGTRCLLGTQASTKIYRSPGPVARQVLTATVESDSLLAVLPDPIVCFADARYEQRQRFELAEDASLLLLDSFTAGRLARGERWAMTRYRSVNDVFLGGRRIARDATELSGDIDPDFRTGRFNCFATLFALGPLLADHAAAMIEQVRSRKLQRTPELLVTASPLKGGTILRFAGVDIEQTTRSIRQLLSFVPSLLGDDPFSRMSLSRYSGRG